MKMNRKNNREDSRYQQTQMQRELILSQLKNKGFRITRQRKMLLDIILKEDCSSCKEIYYKASELYSKSINFTKIDYASCLINVKIMA